GNGPKLIRRPASVLDGAGLETSRFAIDSSELPTARPKLGACAVPRPDKGEPSVKTVTPRSFFYRRILKRPNRLTRRECRPHRPSTGPPYGAEWSLASP